MDDSMWPNPQTDRMGKVETGHQPKAPANPDATAMERLARILLDGAVVNPGDTVIFRVDPHADMEDVADFNSAVNKVFAKTGATVMIVAAEDMAVVRPGQIEATVQPATPAN